MTTNGSSGSGRKQTLPAKIADVNNIDVAATKRRKLEDEKGAAEKKMTANQSQRATVEDSDDDNDDLPCYSLVGVPKNPRSILEAADGSDNNIEEITGPMQDKSTNTGSAADSEDDKEEVAEETAKEE